MRWVCTLQGGSRSSREAPGAVDWWGVPWDLVRERYRPAWVSGGA